MPIAITSLQNSRVKDVIKLAKHSERDQRRVTVVEGIRECTHALAAGIVPVEAYLCPTLFDSEEQQFVQQLYRLEAEHRTLLMEVTPEVFAKIAYRGDSGGILLVIPYLNHQLSDFELSAPAFIAVIEGVEKPGNLGAILRTADAAGVQAVIVTAGVTDIHNPNVIRASLGALFTLPVFESPFEATLAWLAARQIQIIAASPEATRSYTEIDYAPPTAIVMGSEAHGLGPGWRGAATALVKIPMFGAMDSLNLSTSTALLLYEVIRQRRQ
ncbi:MAG: RNA methyltransferase [Caldilineaceae bacterium]|nr:RNA methyltransferase [Caldilineaceae bacterium]